MQKPLYCLLFAVAVLGGSPQLCGQDRKAGSNTGEPANTNADSRFTVPSGGTMELHRFLEELQRKRQEAFQAYNDIRAEAYREYAAVLNETKKAELIAASRIMKIETDKTSDAYLAAATIVLPTRITGLVAASPEEQGKTVDMLKHVFQAKSLTGLDMKDISLANSAVRTLQGANQRALAVDLCECLSELLAGSKGKTARYADSFAGTARRLSLVGNEIKIEGKTIDGATFDWSTFRGKCVLIDFWATWCGPCRAELPKVQAFYNIYHDRGFEVVGISVDTNKAALEKYLEDQKIPWVTLHDKRTDGANSIAQYYGISSIPTMIFVDKQGKVVSLKARSNKLPYLLRKHIGTTYESAKSYAADGQWDRTATEVARVLEARPNDIDTLIALGVAQLMAKENKAYQKTCTIAYNHFANLGPHSRYYLLKLCSIGPDCGIEPDALVKLVEKGFGPVAKARAEFATGIIHFRSGRFQDAIRTLPVDGDAFQLPACAFLRAMAHHELGHQKEARELLNKGIAEANRLVPSAKGPRLESPLAERWVVWSMLQLLRQEATALIGSKAGTP